MSSLSHPPRVAAILGPTNTGKTHYAVERMLARQSGIIGLPLRLLAREVYDKICDLKGARNCALITGEEKIIPEYARYYVCTVEAMPVEKEFAFVAIDEIQLMNNPERGHIFTDRLLHMRGTEETLFLGAETARDLIKRLLPDVSHEYRERFSTLSYGGETKLTRLPKRSVIVAFSASEVYAIAELIRRHRGGAAVVMGALSPRTRNAQAELYQNAEVDFLIATDAVGMGLNLDTDHVAFASMIKFDGRRRRRLSAMEAGQIAGRAGRFRNDGTFGTTGDCQPMDPELISRIENHMFDPMRYAEWRNAKLNFDSLDHVLDCLAQPAPQKGLRRIAPAVDEVSLERMTAIDDVMDKITHPFDVKRLWDICQVPDFRNLTIDAHVRLLHDLHTQLYANDGKLPDDFLNSRINRLDHIDGGVDILSVRLAQIRTWTYCANKASWMNDTKHWIKRTRAVEDRLSDALHESLIARFVDRRTSALLKGIGAGAFMTATIKDNGEVWVDDHKIGHLEGLKFKADDSASEIEAKALNAAAVKAVGPEIDRRLTSLCGGNHDIFTLSDRGEILWGGKPVGRIASSGSVFTPDAELIGGEMGNENLRNLATNRMRDYLRSEVSKKLLCLEKMRGLSNDEKAPPEARGFAYELLQNNGSVSRRDHWKTVKAIDQDARKPMRDNGVVFGQYDIYLKDMMKPKPAKLLSLLTAYGAGGHRQPFIPFAGVTSIPNDGDFASDNFPPEALAVAGYHACGPRIIRYDILNRLGMLIRDAQAQSTVGKRKFQIMQEMLAILGSTYDEVRGVLEALGYKSETIEPAPDSIDPTTADTKDAAPTEGEDKNATPEDLAHPPKNLAQNEELAKDVVPAQDHITDAKADNAGPESETQTANTDTLNPEQKPEKTVRQLSVHHVRIPQEDGTNLVVPNTEYWHMPFRKRTRQTQNRRSRDNNTTYTDNSSRDWRENMGYGGKKTTYKGSAGGGGKKRKRGQNKGSQNGISKRRNHNFRDKETKRMEDSPFAALAALKTPKKPSE